MLPLLDFLNDSNGALIFFLAVFVLSQAALFIALGQRMRGPQERTAGHYTVAAGGILAAWIVLMIGALTVLILHVPQAAILPPLERATDTVIILIIGWAFAVADSPVGARSQNNLFGVLIGGVVVGFLLTLVRWVPAPDPEGFNASSLGVAWTVIPLMAAVIGLATLLLRVRMVLDAPLKFIFFVIMLFGYGYTFYLLTDGQLENDSLGAVRLALLIGMPLWPTVIYRTVVRRLSELADENFLRARVLPPASSAEIVTSAGADNKEAVAVLKALGDMLESQAPEVIPLQVVKAALNALKADVAALLALDDAEYADVIAAYDATEDRPIAALAIKIDEQPSLISALQAKDQRALKTDRHWEELVDLYTRLDIQRIGPAYYQALVKDGMPIAAMVVAFPYTQRELRESEQNLLTAIAPIAARLIAISRSAVRTRDEAGLRALRAAIEDTHPDVAEMSAARQEMQQHLELARSQIGDLNNRVKELQIELDYERSRLASLSGEGSEDTSITQRLSALATERAQLAAERERLATAVQEAQARIIGATARDEDEVFESMIETLQKERDELQRQKVKLESQLEEIRKRGGNVPPPAVLRKLLTSLSEEKARLQSDRDVLADQLGEVSGQLKALGIEGPAGLAQMIGQLTEERTHYKIVAERAMQDREALLDERKRLSDQIAAEAEREAKMNAMEAVIRRLAADREALVSQRDQLRQSLNTQQSDVERWQQERARFVAEAESLQEDMKGLVFERNRLQTDLSKLMELRAALEKERDRLTAERTTIQTERDQLSAAAQGSRELLQRLGADGLETLKQMIDDLTEERSDLEHKLLRAQAQIETLRESLQKAKSRLAHSIPVPEMTAMDASQAEVMLSIAQELRTPMSSIVGYVDLMLGESVGILGALQRQFLQRVKANADRLGNLLEDFVRVTALDTGQLQLQPAPVDMIEIIDDAITATRAQFREKGITLKIDLPDSLTALQGDRDALQQVIIQLLSNAYLASPTDGEIGISAQLVRSFPLPPRPGKSNPSEVLVDGILIGVRDNGAGISPEDQQRVFTRLYRADNPLIQGLGDTGVGLSIARALTEMHGGRIWVESTPGAGSIFKLIVPLQSLETVPPAVSDSTEGINNAP